MCQIINQKEAQYVIISYQDQENKGFVQHLSSKNSSQKNNQSQHLIGIYQDKNDSQNNLNSICKKEDQNKEIQITNQQLTNSQINNLQLEKIDKNLQKDEQKLNNEQIIKSQKIGNQENAYKQERNDSKIDLSQKQEQQICDQEQVIEKLYHTKQKNTLEFQNISEQTSQNSQDKNIPLQPNLLEKSNLKIKQNEQTETQIQQQVMENQQEAIKNTNKDQKNNNDYQISLNGPQKLNNPTMQQEFQSNYNQQQFEVLQNVKIFNIQSQSYFSLLKTVSDKIEEYKFKEEWEQEIFEKIDTNKTQSEIFQSQKQKIFERLQQEQYYLCKIIYSNQIEDLILIFFSDDEQNINELENVNNEYIFKIIYNSDQFQSDINSQNQLFETLGFQFNLIKQNVQQVENYQEINSQNSQECEKCGNQKTYKNQNCFKNKKSRILDTLRKNKYFFCEYSNKLVNGVIFQLNQEDLISEYLYFLHKTIFSSLVYEQNDNQSTFQQQQIQFCENPTEKKYNPSFLQNNNQINNIDQLNEYSFQEYQVLKKSDQNQEKSNFSPNYYREWDINKFNDSNKNKYFLCRYFVSNQQEDILIGYHEQIKENYMDYIFVIKYNPIHSEIQKYFKITKQLNEQINHFIINGLQDQK
ncbi:hypothetical protein ABPG72_017762 [Tetrahymena utriculariae]